MKATEKPMTGTDDMAALPAKKHWFCRDMGAEITTIDLLKAVAILTMVVDHIGYYFIADSDWWRMVGRFSAPLWLFLIGYARSRDIPMRLIACAVLLVLVDAATMQPLLPINILLTIILTRLALPILTRPALLQQDNILVVLLLLACLGVPTWFSFEYGTIAFLFALFGYQVRQGTANYVQLGSVIGVTVLVYALWQQLAFDFNTLQTWIIGIGTLGLMLGLLRFRSQPIPNTADIPVLSSLARLTGRYTLEFYTIHLVIFGVLAFWLADHQEFRILISPLSEAAVEAAAK